MKRVASVLIRPTATESDALSLAVARYIQALEKRYPDGPDQMRRERLASRANMPTVTTKVGPTA